MTDPLKVAIVSESSQSVNMWFYQMIVFLLPSAKVITNGSIQGKMLTTVLHCSFFLVQLCRGRGVAQRCECPGSSPFHEQLRSYQPCNELSKLLQDEVMAKPPSGFFETEMDDKELSATQPDAKEIMREDQPWWWYNYNYTYE